jgi:methionyl-tRNA formyltransferase
LADQTEKLRNLKIFHGTFIPQDSNEPGSITTPNDAEILVGTGRGVLRLDEVQLEGKRRMSGAEFLRGFSSPMLHF